MGTHEELDAKLKLINLVLEAIIAEHVGLDHFHGEDWSSGTSWHSPQWCLQAGYHLQQLQEEVLVELEQASGAGLSW